MDKPFSSIVSAIARKYTTDSKVSVGLCFGKDAGCRGKEVWCCDCSVWSVAA